MKFLTQKQKTFLVRKKIKVGNFYRFPPMGFTVYAEPNYLNGADIETNPFTKSLAHEYFLVKEITINGFYKGNFYDKPKARDMYLSESELSARTLLEIIVLFLILFIPFWIANLIRGGVDKIESKLPKESV